MLRKFTLCWDPEHFTRCCGPEWDRQCCWGDRDYFKVDNGEFIDGFKKGTGKSAKDDVDVHLPHKPVSSKGALLLSDTKSVLQDEKLFNGFLIEIAVVITMLVVMCIICSIPLIIKRKARGGDFHDQADQEEQQLEFHHQEGDLHQGVVRSYSARTYRPRSARPPHPLPRCHDPPPAYPGPYPGGDAAYRQLIRQLFADTEDVDLDLPSYDESWNSFRSLCVKVPINMAIKVEFV